MSVETVLVGLLVLAAAAYLVRSIIQAARTSNGSCGGGCRCSEASKAASDRLGRMHELIQLGTNTPNAAESPDSPASIRHRVPVKRGDENDGR
ncbi:MAG: FeoB-associated Cys-rich membrane protein [Phycisphaerae bacterium]|nr:FeoB-associated Cys-rich membrane protein [Phycisphaerae bacterium]